MKTNDDSSTELQGKDPVNQIIEACERIAEPRLDDPPEEILGLFELPDPQRKRLIRTAIGRGAVVTVAFVSQWESEYEHRIQCLGWLGAQASNELCVRALEMSLENDPSSNVRQEALELVHRIPLQAAAGAQVDLNPDQLRSRVVRALLRTSNAEFDREIRNSASNKLRDLTI